MTHRLELTTGDETARVGMLEMPKDFTVHLVDDDGGEPDVDLVFQVRAGRPECREVHIRATEDGHEVRVSGLAGIRIEDCLEQAIKHMWDGILRDVEASGLSWLINSEYSHRLAVQETRKARVARKIKITDSMLREVAEIYRANVKDRPTEAVAEHFGKQHRTATLYIKRARDRGFLGAAVKGKAGETNGAGSIVT
jgi:hypothetical protein